MRKSEIIGRVLMNLGTTTRLDEAEFLVRKQFEICFKDHNFNRWNTDVYDGQRIVDNIGRPMSVNVEKFIQDLWNTK